MVRNLHEVRSYDDLKKLKLRRKYELEMEKIRFESFRIQLSSMLSFEGMMQNAMYEGRRLAQIYVFKFLGNSVKRLLKG